jgi:hypothetical protein
MKYLTPLLAIALLVFLLFGGFMVKNKSIFSGLNQESFENDENPFKIPLGMSRYKNYEDGEFCDVKQCGPIISATCNRVPIFPKGLRPLKNIMEYSEDLNNSERLAPKEGQFTFIIPEFKYDGIWSQTDKCCWSLNNNNKISTYGNNKLSPIPEESMFGRTIIEPPECEGLWPSSKQPITFIYDCHKDVPCSTSKNIPCPTRV